MKEKETSEAQGASVVPQDVTGTKFSQFKRIESSENLEVVGVEGPVNVRMPLRTSNIATDPDVALFDDQQAPDLKNQLEVNRYLAAKIDGIEFPPGTIVGEEPEAPVEAGTLWFDISTEQLYVRVGDEWFKSTNLDELYEAISQGEALQSEILGRVEAGEDKQAVIETNAMTKGGAQTLTDDSWSIKTGDGKTYAMIADEEITMYHVANPEAPKQPTNKEYVDNADKKMQTDISNLEAKVTELEGSIGEHRFVYNNEQVKP